LEQELAFVEIGKGDTDRVPDVGVIAEAVVCSEGGVSFILEFSFGF